MRVLLLRNPSSGARRRRAQFARLERELEGRGFEVSLVEPESAEQTRDAASRARRSEHDVVVAVGGDGTLSAVANGLVRTPIDERPPLSILPAGRGNDFAAALGLRSVDDTVASIVERAPRRVDLARADAGFFLGVGGIGFDAQAARRAKGTPVLTGRLLYGYAVLRTLFEFQHVEARLRYAGGAYEGPLTFAAVGNTWQYGGGMRITPRADISDGLVDLCIVKDISPATLLYMFPTVFSGGHLSHPLVEYVQTPFVEIETAEPAELYADGELLQETPARIEAVPGALEILTPRRRNPAAR